MTRNHLYVSFTKDCTVVVSLKADKTIAACPSGCVITREGIESLRSSWRLKRNKTRPRAQVQFWHIAFPAGNSGPRIYTRESRDSHVSYAQVQGSMEVYRAEATKWRIWPPAYQALCIWWRGHRNRVGRLGQVLHTFIDGVQRKSSARILWKATRSVLFVQVCRAHQLLLFFDFYFGETLLSTNSSKI